MQQAGGGFRTVRLRPKVIKRGLSVNTGSERISEIDENDEEGEVADEAQNINEKHTILETLVSKGPIITQTKPKNMLKTVPAEPEEPDKPPGPSPKRIAMSAFRSLYADQTPADDFFDSVEQHLGRFTPAEKRYDTPVEEVEKIDELLNADVAEVLGIRPTRDLKSTFNIENIHSSYGWGGRVKFMTRLRRHKRTDGAIDDADPYHFSRAEKRDGLSDHSIDKYINTCQGLGILPEPLVVHKHAVPSLEIAHYGVGDLPANALSTCLPELSSLAQLNVRNNRLSDRALAQLLSSSKDTRIQTIDLSQNQIGRACIIALCDLLKSPTCEITRLVLNHGLKQFQAAKMLVDALGLNKTVTALEMRDNNFDSRVGKLIPTLLVQNQTLEHLNFAWNNLRSAGIKHIAQALVSRYLVEVNLGWNGLNDGVLEFASSLRRDTTAIKRLDLSGNNLSGQTTIALAHAWIDNPNLQILVLGDNPIGEAGIRAIFRAFCHPFAHLDATRTIEFCGCNFNFREGDVFDPNEIIEKEFTDFDIETQPFNATIVAELLRKVWIGTATSIYPLQHTVKNKTTFYPPRRRSSISRKGTGSVSLSPRARTSAAATAFFKGGPLVQRTSSSSVGTQYKVPFVGTLSFTFRSDRKQGIKPISADAVEKVVHIIKTHGTTEILRVQLSRLFLQDHCVTQAQAQKLQDLVAKEESVHALNEL